MRILAGIYKGRSIKTSVKSNYRPTKSVVRKSIFDTLGILSGCTILDLYAGTGILGFEALSRGARQVTFVDNNPYIVKQLNQNANLFDHSGIIIEKIEAELFLRNSTNFDIIICDPPYGKTDLNSLVEICISKLEDTGQLVLESAVNDQIPKSDKEKIFGQTKISYWSKA